MPIFRLGDMVRIKSGPFQSFTGRIDGINQARMLLRVRVQVYGRTQPTKVRFSEVEKLGFPEDKSDG